MPARTSFTVKGDGDEVLIRFSRTSGETHWYRIEPEEARGLARELLDTAEKVEPRFVTDES